MQELVNEIVEKIKKLMNGPVSTSMRNLGIDYKFNYGVSVPELQKIAHQYKNNHELALQLYKEDIRECKLLASMIDEPEKVTGEQIDDWAQDFTNTEIVEQVCSNLFWKSEYALSRSIEWCIRDDEMLQKAGLIIAARSATKVDIKDVVFEPYIEVIEGFNEIQISQNKSTIAFALRQIGQRNSNLREKVLELSTQMAQSGDEHRAWIGNQLLFELGGED